MPGLRPFRPLPASRSDLAAAPGTETSAGACGAGRSGLSRLTRFSGFSSVKGVSAAGITLLAAAAAAASLAASWLRWVNPFVDSGREMDVPARLAAGERLYRDVTYYYGPAGPWLHSLAIRACGPGCRSWLPQETVCLLLSAAILLLLFRLTLAAGGQRSAAAVTALAAAFCLGAPNGGAFIFPYSASSLYALAGSLLALTAALRPASWRRRVLVDGGTALALTARLEIGAATVLILLIVALRTRREPAPGGVAAPAVRAAVSDVWLALAVGGIIYAIAFAGIPWHMLIAEGPLTHLLAMPPEWKALYALAAGLAFPERSLANLAWALLLDALLLAACAWAALPRILFWVAAAIGTAAYALGWVRWGPLAGDLPPLLLPLPLVAAAAALAILRRPLDERDRARFMLFALAAALATRVLLGFKVGRYMTAFCALPLPLLLATAGVLTCDLLAPRLPNPATFRRRIAALALALAALYLYQLGRLSWGPHMVQIETPAGSLRLPWKEATAIDGTLAYLGAHARPGDTLASFPEAGFFNFVTGLRNPLRQEQIFPGVLDPRGEREAARRLLDSRPRFILLANRPTREFGARSFGDDYAIYLWSTVEDHYSRVATFGNAPAESPVGASRFFIRVYEPDP